MKLKPGADPPAAPGPARVDRRRVRPWTRLYDSILRIDRQLTGRHKSETKICVEAIRPVAKKQVEAKLNATKTSNDKEVQPGAKGKTGAHVRFRSSRAFRPEASTPAVLGHLKATTKSRRCQLSFHRRTFKPQPRSISSLVRGSN